MKKCAECQVEYPDGYLAPLMTSEGARADFCGICALEISNKLHGINRTSFDGEMAEDMRQLAVKWRKAHGL